MNQEDIIKELQNVFNSEAQSILLAATRIDESYIKALNLIISAKKLIISGVGKSGHIAAKIAATFSSYGIPAIFLHPTEALHGDVGVVTEGDVVIAISKSGTTEELIKLFPHLKQKVKIISIVGNLDSYIAYNSDVTLNASIDKEACSLNIAPTSSTTLALAIGDALAVVSVIMRKFTKEDFAKNHPLGQLGKNLTLKVDDLMHKGSFLPKLESGSNLKNGLIEMTNKALGCLCIEENGKLLGIITDGDVRRALTNYDDIRDLKIDDIMTKNPISISSDMLIGNALSLMENRDSQINVLPVVDNENRCIGVIRLHDIVKVGI